MFVDQYQGVVGGVTEGGQVWGSRGGPTYNGGIVEGLSGIGWDTGYSRPFIGHDNQVRVIVNTGRWTVEKGQRYPIRESRRLMDLINNGSPAGFRAMQLAANATALRKEEWIELDRVVLRAARYRLRAWADLASRNSFGGFNGMSKMILEHEVMSDPGEAIVDMDGLTDGRGDAPKFQLRGLPLPITHADFWFSSRVLSISRNTGTPLDTTMGEASGRRIGETLEKTLIGNQAGAVYGGASTYVGGYDQTSQVYGYLTHPNRISSTNFYKPTGNGRAGTGWLPQDTVLDVLGAIDTLRAHKFYGPFFLYHSNDWDQYLDRDYIAVTSGVGGATTGVTTATLRQRLLMIGKEADGETVIEGVKRLDFLFSSLTDQSSGGPGLENLTSANAFTMILVQMTPDVCRAVNGMDITTIQWESVGGMRLNFKVLCIQVPQLRSDFYGNAGIGVFSATK